MVSQRSSELLAMIEALWERLFTPRKMKRGEQSLVRTGPLFVCEGVTKDEFWALYKETNVHKYSPIWLQQNGMLFTQGDPSAGHDHPRHYMSQETYASLCAIGVDAKSPKRVVALTVGGLLEFPDRFHHVDFLVLERSSPDISFEVGARTVIAGIVCHRNEHPDKALESLEQLVREDGGAQLAFAIIVGLEEPIGTEITVYVKVRGQETVETNVIEFKWKELFTEKSLLESFGDEAPVTAISVADMKELVVSYFT